MEYEFLNKKAKDVEKPVNEGSKQVISMEQYEKRKMIE